MIAPTDKSMPPETMIIVIPSAAIADDGRLPEDRFQVARIGEADPARRRQQHDEQEKDPRQPPRAPRLLRAAGELQVAPGRRSSHRSLAVVASRTSAGSSSPATSRTGRAARGT